MYSELQGKVALITGASRGFGAAIAHRLAKEGCTIILNYRRSRAEAESIMESIHAAGGKALAIKADVGDEDKIDAMFEFIEDEFGRCDILVPNASFGVPGQTITASSKHWDATFNSTAKSVMLLSQRAVPLMKDWGRIVTVTSYGGQRVLEQYGIVGPAKAAVESLTRSLAVELAPHNILVNGIMPGVCDTKSFNAIPNAETVLVTAKEKTPVGRLVTPEDAADVVAFLCSDQSRMICGQFITIDGGAFIVN
ncbi:SDR family oxidoreductase [bacterium]|jgi:enoyl-[acyl-carrier protein] reductase III|nr:SDR family oxidoreductase [bacterium]